MIKQSFKRRVLRRFSTRWHMFFILLAVAAAGVLISKLLLLFTEWSLAARWAAAVFGSYLFFFLLLKVWLWLAARRLYLEPRESGLADLLEVAADAVNPSDLPSSSGPTVTELGRASTESEGGLGGGLADAADLGGDEGGLLVVLVIAVGVVLLGTGIYVIWQAPLILSEALFEVVLVASLGRRARRLGTGEWTSGVLRATWLPALIVLGLAIGLGLAIAHYCPDAQRVADVFGICQAD